MSYQLNARDKKYRKKEREDWMWYEDPYKGTAAGGWYHDHLESQGHDVPAPSPLFGTEPPIHTAMRAI